MLSRPLRSTEKGRGEMKILRETRRDAHDERDVWD